MTKSGCSASPRESKSRNWQLQTLIDKRILKKLGRHRDSIGNPGRDDKTGAELVGQMTNEGAPSPVIEPQTDNRIDDREADSHTGKRTTAGEATTVAETRDEHKKLEKAIKQMTRGKKTVKNNHNFCLIHE